MADFDAKTAECKVFTFKEGVLSAVAHDLAIKVTRFLLKIERPSLEARFDAASLVVECVMRDGQAVRGVLAQRELDKIAATIIDEVLKARRYPEIRFTSTEVVAEAGRATVKGQLTLAGETRPCTVEARREGACWVAEASLHQPDFGIKPYSAMFGTIRIKPDVRVRVSVAADAVDAATGGS